DYRVCRLKPRGWGKRAGGTTVRPCGPAHSALPWRMPNFPAPRADELLYSVIARAAVHLGYWSPKGLLEAVYEDRSMLACPDLPVGVARIARVSHGTWGLTLQELATRHTLLGYYIHFLPSAARTKALERMLQRSGHLHVRLGICT